MSLLCCLRSRQPTSVEPDQELVDLPPPPPAAKLSKQPLPAPEVELPSPPIVVTQHPSLLQGNQIPEATVDPTILEIEDSDDDEPARSIRNSSTGTLEAIRTKFARRLSEGSGSKRNSQQSLGTSDEEVARRAELKRLMHKRIQEELKSEEEQDEEPCTKMSTIDELTAVGPSRVALPGGGPRDNIEFSVSDVSEAGSKDCATNGSPDIVLLAPPPSDLRRSASHRRSTYSNPRSASQSHEDPVSEPPGTLKERASLPQLPSSPQLAPVYLPSIKTSESLCSWRLSYSAERVASYLGAHGETRSVTDSDHGETDVEKEEVHEHAEQSEQQADHAETHSSDDQGSRPMIEPAATPDKQQPSLDHALRQDQSNVGAIEDPFAEISHDEDSVMDSLDLWLRSQEVQSNSAVSSRRTSDMILQMIPDSFDSRLRQSVDIDGSVLLGGMRSISNASAATPRNPLPTSKAVVAIGPTEQPSAEYGEQQRPVGDHSGAPDDTDHAREISSSHYTSSRYTTRPNSCQTIAKESRFSLVDLLGERRAISPFSNFNRLISPSRATDAEKSRSDVSSYKTAHNEASALDLIQREVYTPQHPIDEAGPAAFSDTASFKHRETELESIAKRFGHFQSRRNITTPIVSKFQEEFIESRASASTKHSIFAKLHLQMLKRSKHPTKDTHTKSRSVENLGSATSYMLQQNSKKAIITELPVTPTPSDQEHVDIEGALGQRQRSLKHEPPQHRRNWPESQGCRENTQTNQSAHLTTPTREPVDSQRAISSSKAACVIGMLDPASRVDDGQTLKPPSHPEDGSSPSLQSDISNSVLREWINLMNDEDSQGHVEPKPEPQNRSLLRFKTPPASWAKWPSHTRQERNGPAGEKDDVIPRDFAVRVGSNGSSTGWSTDKPHDSPRRYIASESRSLSTEVGKFVKGSLDKVQGTLNIDRRTSADSDHAYRESYGHLEYPELEILPMNGGYKELQALEQQIGTIKRKSLAPDSQLAVSSSGNTRPPLSARLASEVHMIQHKTSRNPCLDNQDDVATPSAKLPVAPKQALLPPKGAPEGKGYVETPESQVTYEDCVPKHMLEDERSVEDSAVAEHAHNAPAA
ncbi:hypothetical protein GGR53DRAFT_463827 [Hypoxylon sp. FL1150]|nr:hypothetical protein GGR53DRAFT_463827 [Hypoxylon sp. FL1150]